VTNVSNVHDRVCREIDRSAETRPSLWVWIIIWAIALATRLLASFLLPNAEQDGYSYAEKIAQLSANLIAGSFRLADLFGFWLPLFQFAAAIPNVWINHPLLAGKILSSLCGATSCVLVFSITEKVTRNIALAGLTFALLVLNPLHILYSAAAMTDVPYGCLILASLWFLLQNRWLGAIIFAAMAESVRIEAWALILLLPLLQWAHQRRVSPLIIAILFLPPLGWLLISHLATGDAFAYFAERARYHAAYLDSYPTRREFALADINRDAVYFLLGANRIVFLGLLFASGVLIFQAVRRSHRVSWPVLFVAGYAVALLGFVLFAYVAKRQPVLFPRYALVFFALGLPLLAWLLQLLIAWHRHPADGTRAGSPCHFGMKCVAAILIAFCFWQAKGQMPIISKVRDDFRAHRQIADAVANALQQSPDDESRCFSDNPAVRVLSRLPPERFVRSATTPVAARQDIGVFQAFLREQRVAYLVFTRIEDSLPVKFYPQLGRNGQTDTGNFQLIAVASSPFGPDVWLYRVRD
jgi:hypothetical protein